MQSWGVGPIQKALQSPRDEFFPARLGILTQACVCLYVYTCVFVCDVTSEWATPLTARALLIQKYGGVSMTRYIIRNGQHKSQM